MTLLRAASQLHVLVTCQDQVLESALLQQLTSCDVNVPNHSEVRPEIIVVEAGDADADVLVVQVGGSAGLDLFREIRDRYPVNALIVYGREADAELADVATQHGADDILYHGELTPELVRRVVAYAVERNGLTRQLVAAREREAQLATHDSVTGLANRSLLFTCIAQAIAFASRQQTGLAVVILDIQHLAQLNQRFGYRAGDKVLSVVAERILDAIRTSDMAGRLGGDEFIILLRDITARGGAGQAVESILREIARPLYVAGHKVSARAGIAFCPTDGDNAETLAALAHDALNTARAQDTSYHYATSDTADKVLTG